MSIVTRFAPSPTGRLHLGHGYSAAIAHRFAAERGGRFLLRIEDIDRGRAREAFVEAIFEDLAWLGLRWEEPVWRQSHRLDAYAAALATLKERGLLYPCFCTRADIAASASAPHGPAGPVYPGTCRDRPDGWKRAEDEAHALRLNVEEALMTEAAGGGALVFEDDGQPIRARPESSGDIVLARKDAPVSYHLAVVVDDAAQGVTDVVRGCDLLEATHVQRLLQALLGLARTPYHHHALVIGADGHRLAKRNQGPTLADLRDAGVNGRELGDALKGGRLPVGFTLSAP